MSNVLKKSGLALVLIHVAACAQAQPLSITLVNPKTNAVMKCAAYQSPIKPSSALADVVEICAEQLEARGFVRVDEGTAAQLMSK